MIIHRPLNTRATVKADWITSYRTFSFPPYRDPRYINFSHLQTINDDRVQPGGHVPWHEHKNMEIFGYVVEGQCRHTDSHGKEIDIPAGAVQRMSSGSSIWHTEGNSGETPNRYLQLWIQPSELDTDSCHDWHQFTREDKLNRFCDITEKLPIKQDARLLAGIFTEDYQFAIDTEKKYYLYVVTGSVVVNGINLSEGDGLRYIDEAQIIISEANESEIILFELCK